MILAIMLLIAAVATIAIWQWQVPGRRLKADQIQGYVDKLERQLPLPPAQAGTFIASLADFASRDDGRPFYMLNLMKFRDELLPVPGLSPEHAETPKKANAYYEQNVIPLALKLGAYPVGAGMSPEPPALPGPSEAVGWDRIIMMRYPSRRAFFDLLTDPAYADFVPYKFASVELGLIPVSAQSGFAEPRWLALAFTLGLGFATVVAWAN